MKEEDVIRTVRAIVDQEALPGFIHSYDVVPGDIEGDPAVWVRFYMEPDGVTTQAQFRQQVDAIRTLKGRLRRTLLDTFDDRAPYVRVQGRPRQEAAAG